MPFGLQGAPAVFQRMVDKILNGLNAFASAYIEDVIVFSGMWRDHLQVVLKKIQEGGLTVKRKKCQFGMSDCRYVGNIIGSGWICRESAKVEAVRNFEQPATNTRVRPFLGLTGYYRKFIPDYATLAAPLTDLTRKKSQTR